MKIIAILIGGACAVFVLVYIFFTIADWIKKYRRPTKTIKKFTNMAGQTFWRVYLNNKSTYIKWSTYADALFCYEHIVKKPSFHYQYECLQENPYYVLYMDKCKLYIIPEGESEHGYSDLNEKYVYRLGKRNKTLEYCYNNVITHDEWESEVVLTNDVSKELEDEIDMSITNKDIKALRKIIKDYSTSVELSNVVAEKLINNMNK